MPQRIHSHRSSPAVEGAAVEAITSRLAAPLNTLTSCEFIRTQLASVGVARISTSSQLYRAGTWAAIAQA